MTHVRSQSCSYDGTRHSPGTFTVSAFLGPNTMSALRCCDSFATTRSPSDLTCYSTHLRKNLVRVSWAVDRFTRTENPGILSKTAGRVHRQRCWTCDTFNKQANSTFLCCYFRLSTTGTILVIILGPRAGGKTINEQAQREMELDFWTLPSKFTFRS